MLCGTRMGLCVVLLSSLPFGCQAGSTSCDECDSCVPDCVDKACGPDGCGGTCSPGCADFEQCLEATGECCNPVWQDSTSCDCLPTLCTGCSGTKQQIDGCGNSQTVSCDLPTGCGDICCNEICCEASQICHQTTGSCCAPESNAAFCARLGRNCGTATDTDNCEQTRTVSCGACPELAVEAIHHDAFGRYRSINGFYQNDTTHYVSSVAEALQVGSATYNHALTILNVAGSQNTVTVDYYDDNGWTASVSNTVAARGFVTVLGSDAGLTGFFGSAVVTSSELSVVEVAVANDDGIHRGYQGTPDSEVSSTLYSPIAYDRVFDTYTSTFSLQNAGSSTILASQINITLYCNDGSPAHVLTNANALLPHETTYFSATIPVGLLQTYPTLGGGTYDGFCPDSGEITSVLFGHAVITSPQPLAGDVVVVDSVDNTQRQAGLSQHLSTQLYAPSIILGDWLGTGHTSSLNIANPNVVPANVWVDVFRKSGGVFTYHETRRPQAPGEDACDYTVSSPIPAMGERSFFFKADISQTTCIWDEFGAGENAFAFAIIRSDVPVTASYNKTNSSASGARLEDYAEPALAADRIGVHVWVAQVFKGFLGTYDTRVNVLNPSIHDGDYRLDYYDGSGNLVLSQSNVTIAAESVFVPDLSSLPAGTVHSLWITPAP